MTSSAKQNLFYRETSGTCHKRTVLSIRHWAGENNYCVSFSSRAWCTVFRCLRHRNDWGALVLIDERLVEQASKSRASEFLPPEVAPMSVQFAEKFFKWTVDVFRRSFIGTRFKMDSEATSCLSTVWDLRGISVWFCTQNAAQRRGKEMRSEFVLGIRCASFPVLILLSLPMFLALFSQYPGDISCY